MLQLLVEFEHVSSTSLQFRRTLRADLQSLELIDAAGNYFRRVEGSSAGVDWEVYRRGGLFAPVALLFGLVFLTVMVRIRLKCAEAPMQLSLAEIKAKVSEAVAGNPRAYTYAPPEEIVQRVNAARSTASLIRSIARD